MRGAVEMIAGVLLLIFAVYMAESTPGENGGYFLLGVVGVILIITGGERE